MVASQPVEHHLGDSADGRVEEIARKEFSRATEEYVCVPTPTR